MSKLEDGVDVHRLTQVNKICAKTCTPNCYALNIPGLLFVLKIALLSICFYKFAEKLNPPKVQICLQIKTFGEEIFEAAGYPEKIL